MLKFFAYNFKTFRYAIELMNQVAPGCDIALHHPRWENVWRTVRVYLTTWDIGHQISDRDIQLAKYFDKAFSDFPGAKLDR
ncbi:4a-hydroxytetrahydrobiopterin dehydratase [Nostoc sp. C117]|uniref:4a-hydroxytetrahydrobiopterin dehydratase n=1 Tax=Nostoc sp. C117 TaxID=3349875 RepID=UPI00370DA0DB